LRIPPNDEVRRAVWVNYARLQQLASRRGGAHTLLRRLCDWLDLDMDDQARPGQTAMTPG